VKEEKEEELECKTPNCSAGLARHLSEWTNQKVQKPSPP